VRVCQERLLPHIEGLWAARTPAFRLGTPNFARHAAAIPAIVRAIAPSREPVLGEPHRLGYGVLMLNAVSKKAVAAIPLIAAVLLTGCAGNRNKADTHYVARDVSTLYNAAKLRLDRGDYRVAGPLFDEVERQHPYSPWARRAQVMAAFSYYAGKDYTKSIQAAQRFLSIHPGNKDAPYAYYLIALCYYEQISDISRDQKVTEQAQSALGELVRRYPNTKFASDARLKLDLVNDHLAGKEMEIGRFYQRRGEWLAATLRFRSVIDTYQTTTHTPEALERLVECYLSLGLPQEAEKSAAVLGANYRGSEWYQRAFKLMQEHPAKAGSAG
jgi:outer membrane protein assembly factor BamD